MPDLSPQQLKDLIGKSFPPSEWFEIDQQRVNNFADVTIDHQFIHIDPEKAKHTPFGGTIAHGFLTLSLMTYFADQGPGFKLKNAAMGVNYGFDKIRFLAPVSVGSKVRAHFKLLDITEKKPGQFLLKSEVSLEIEGNDTPALIAEWLTMQIVQ